ncbi:MAG: glycosyltransferase family 4 protein [Solirubrobacteraceae bacterium]
MLSSSNQLYSGTGRVLFETLGRLLDRLDLSVSIDDLVDQNVAIARAFCDRHDVPIVVGPSTVVPGAPDSASALLPELLAQPWDVVLSVSWANAATNALVHAHLPDHVSLVYLPLHQPTWTVPLDEQGVDIVERTHRAMLRRADVVICISPWERRAVTDLVLPAIPRTAVVPPGCDFVKFRPGSDHRPVLLFVGDHRESRKRFDRVVRVLERVRASGNDARLLVVGNESARSTDRLTPEVAAHVDSVGFVEEAQLIAAYQSSAVLLLLSEYEAFGLPVVEALASGTPAIVTDLPAARSLFDGRPGVFFVDGDDADGTAAIVSAILSDPDATREAIGDARGELQEAFSWDRSAQRTLDQILAAWARRARASGGLASGTRRAG